MKTENELEELKAAAYAAKDAWEDALAVYVVVCTAEQATVEDVAKKVVAEGVTYEIFNTRSALDAITTIKNAYTVAKAITGIAKAAKEAAWDAYMDASKAAELW